MPVGSCSRLKELGEACCSHWGALQSSLLAAMEAPTKWIHMQMQVWVKDNLNLASSLCVRDVHVYIMCQTQIKTRTELVIICFCVMVWMCDWAYVDYLPAPPSSHPRRVPTSSGLHPLWTWTDWESKAIAGAGLVGQKRLPGQQQLPGASRLLIKGRGEGGEW